MDFATKLAAHIFPSRWLTALVAGFAVSTAFAGSIVLETTTRYDAAAGEVRWTIANSGDALADALVVTAFPPQGPPSRGASAFLDGGDSVSGVLPASVSLDEPGKHLVPLRIDYADASGETHATLAWARAFVGVDAATFKTPISAALAPPSSLCGGATQTTRFWTLGLAAHSSAPENVVATLRLLLPDGLDATSDAPRTLTIPANGIAVAEIGVTNRAFRRAGAAPVAVLLEFETSDGLHHAVEAPAKLQVGTAESPVDPATPERLPREITLALVAIWGAMFARGLRQRLSDAALPAGGAVWAWGDAALVAGLTLYLGWMLQAPLVGLDTLCVGGDTPAHHYLITRIRETGRIVSWAPGWWSGFPMFRFYFPLPYAAMALLEEAIPHNVAFKLGSIAGLLALPASLYASGRILRLHCPAPAMLACLAVPLALDNTHNMWGVNAYSTLAGMIANSWSFALMPPAMAMACRDALDRRFRVPTAFMLAAMVLSHFFTSMMAALVLADVLILLAVLPGLRKSGEPPTRRPWAVLAATGVCTALLSAWWVAPLVAERAWAVDFGGRWDIRFFRQLPPMATWPMLVAVAAGLMAAAAARAHRRLVDGGPDGLWLYLHVELLFFSLLLFFVGGMVSDVFVNCRFWPFIVYAMLVAGAMAFAYASRKAGLQGLGTAVCLCACLSFAWRTGGREGDPPWSRENHVRHWARYNFQGLEGIREGGVVREIAERVRGTGGRFSQDMHPGHEALGSSRVFEALPHLCGKPVLEGGIVNSALGSLAAYTVQCEISQHPAGWPLLVKPPAFNPALGLRHLEFMNVRQFVARGRRVQEAFDADAGWLRIGDYGGGKWKLYESRLASASPVRVWNEPLPVFRTAGLQRDLLEWMYVPSAVERPAVLVGEGTPAPPDADVLPHGRYCDWLASLTNGPPAAGWLDAVSTPCDDFEWLPDGGIRFRTSHPGRPHVVAVSYHPGWTVRGADAVYFLTPGYLAVYPTQSEVILRRSDGAVARTSRWASIAVAVALGALAVGRAVRPRAREK